MTVDFHKRYVKNPFTMSDIPTVLRDVSAFVVLEADTYSREKNHHRKNWNWCRRNY